MTIGSRGSRVEGCDKRETAGSRLSSEPTAEPHLWRVVAALCLVLCFAALPGWFLSQREGWIALDCTRAPDASVLSCTITERFAFSARRATYDVLGSYARGLVPCAIAMARQRATSSSS